MDSLDNRRAYLDIETSFKFELTVVGLYRADVGIFAQLVGDSISEEAILSYLSGVDTICTYNGNRFDLPIIKRNLGLDLHEYFDSSDLMYDCWRNNLYGGLKAVERNLGIPRSIFGINEDDPRVLWVKYADFGDLFALERLLDYNKQDTLNLLLLEDRLMNTIPTGELKEVEISRYDRHI